jgi:hypothetical protein
MGEYPILSRKVGRSTRQASPQILFMTPLSPLRLTFARKTQEQNRSFLNLLQVILDSSLDCDHRASYPGLPAASE